MEQTNAAGFEAKRPNTALELTSAGHGFAERKVTLAPLAAERQVVRFLWRNPISQVMNLMASHTVRFNYGCECLSR